MDPVTLLWIFSLLGAAGFAATGYWYGRIKVAEEVAAARGAGASDVHRASTVPPPNANAAGEAAETLERMKAQAREAASDEAAAEKAAAIEAATRETDERLAAQRAEIEARFADEKAAADEALNQISALREELRVEILARTEAERRSADLTSRLVSSSQQVAALRAKAGLTPEAPAVRQSSMTPVAPRVSGMPPSMNPQRMQSLAPGLFGELEDLRREVERLKRENETLRVAAFVKRQE